MDDVGWLALALFILSLLLVFFATISKKALSSAGPVYLQALTEQENAVPDSTEWLRRRPVQVHSTLSVTRVISAIIATCLGIALAVDIFSLDWGILLLTILILLICFYLLWSLSTLIANKYTERILKSLSGALKAISVICWPVVQRIIQTEEDKPRDMFELDKAGPLEADQHEMIKGIFDLQQTTAREIMVPRVDIVAVEKNTPITELVDLMVREGYSRIPIYQDTIDNIVGVINSKDLLNILKEGKHISNLEQLIHPAYFIPESKKVDELLREFKEKRLTQAIVVDEYGGIAGLVSIKDVLEEIVGEIANEYDSSQPQIDRLSATEAILDAKVTVDALNEEFNVKLEADGFDTVGGLVLHQLGRMAITGDEIKIGNLLFSVISTLGRRIQKIKVTQMYPSEISENDKPGN